MLPHALQIRPTVATVDLGRLATNLIKVKARIGSAADVIAVVKADAYGHGVVPVARELSRLGIWGFGVATVEEGIELRAAGIKLPILVMGAAFGSQHRTTVQHRLTPVIGDASDLERFAAVVRRRRSPLDLHIKVDTGMARLGLMPSVLEATLKRLARHPTLRINGLMTHLACADVPDDGVTRRQLDLFSRSLDMARTVLGRPVLAHAANSAACLRFPSSRFDLVRPGIALYGVSPGETVPQLGLEPVMGFLTRINAIRHLEAGAPVGYGGTFVTRRPSRIATIPVGYADGYPRALSNRAHVVVRGRLAPLVGSVCMDLSMVDVSEIEGAAVGDLVTLIGAEGDSSVSVETLAEMAGTIPYEILCGISKRVPRIYSGQSAASASVGGPKGAPRSHQACG